MAERKPIFLNLTGGENEVEEMATSDSITLGGLTMGGDINMNSAGKVTNANAATTDGDVLVYGQSGANLAGLDIDTADLTMNDRKITGLGAPTADGDATTKAYVDQQVTQGRVWREAVLHATQLDNTDGINAAVALVLQNQAVDDDRVVLTDGSTTRTYYFGTGTGDVSVTIGGTVAESMQNLASAIEGDGSSIWGAVFTTDLDGIDSDGVVVIIEDANSGTAPEIYGTNWDAGDCQIVDFGGEYDYTKKTLENIPSSDPASTNFGFRRTQANLVDGETHVSLEDDVLRTWDDSGNVWQTTSGAGSIPDATSASGGGVKGKVTFDSDKGLSVTSGIAEVTLAASAGLKFTGGSLAIEPNDFAGTGLEDDGADNLRLAAQGNGIAGGAGSTLSVDPDSESGGNIAPVSVGSNGVGLDIDTIDGDGLSADGSARLQVALDGSGSGLELTGTTPDKTLGIKLEASNPTLQIDGSNQLGAKLDGTKGVQAGSGGIEVKVDATTISFDGSGQLQAVGSAEAERIENTLTTATDATSNGDPVYINGNSTIGKSLANDLAKSRVIGVIRTGAGVAGSTPEVVSHGKCAGILSSATAGTRYFLQDAGGINTSLPAAGSYVVRVGYAFNADDLWVRIRHLGKRAA